MSNEITTQNTKSALTTENCTIEQLLCCNSVKQLATSLKLNDVQIAKANNAVLDMATDEKLAGTTQMSKVRYAYRVAQANYKNPDAIAPIKYGNCVQAQAQYQAYIEDMLECGHVKETNAVCLFEGVDYKQHINKLGMTELTLPSDIPQNDMFAKPKVIGYYAYAITDDERVATCIMSLDQINAHASRYSKSFNANFSPWKTNPDEMGLKTCIKSVGRQILKWFPFDRLAKAIEIDQMVFDENGQSYKDNPQNDRPATKSNVSNSIAIDNETGEVVDKK